MWRNLYITRIDGADVFQLTNDDGLSHNTSWSYDGTKIAFSYFDGHIYTINTDGTNRKRITHNEGDIQQRVSSSWSPDDTRLVIGATDSHTHQKTIYIVQIDNGNEHSIVEGQSPEWSPTGRMIVFDAMTGITVVTPNGDGERLVDDHPNAKHPSWAPDGRRIVFAEGGRRALVIINADGSNRHEIPLAAPEFPNMKHPNWR